MVGNGRATAQVEADDETVNLSRFNQLFPEKRQFFSEPAGLFGYGAASEREPGGGPNGPQEPGLLQVEGRLPEATVAELARRGHRIARMDDWSLGRLCAVGKDGDVLKAAAHPRFMQAYAAGR